jgi:hypothetical protein
VEIRTGDREILARGDSFLERPVDPDLVLVGLPSHLKDRARVGEALEHERLDSGGLVGLGPAAVDVLTPLLAQLFIRNPPLENAVEALPDVEQLVLELAPLGPFGLSALVFVVEMLVVADERVQLLVERQSRGLR